MRTSQKVPTWAVYGFFNAIFSLLKQTQPDAIAVSFDVSRITFRNDLYPEYKSHRERMPDELRAQMDLIRQGVQLLGIPIYELEGYEADDVIGTLACKAAEKGYRVQILTGDQDTFQLVDHMDGGNAGKIEVLIPSRKPREGLLTYDRDAIYKKLGVYPEQVTDYKGLRGDTSDNIPGIPGVGEKTAVKFLTQYQTLENLYQHVDELPKNKMQEKLVTFHDQAVLSKQLATINTQVPLVVNFEDCHLVIPDSDALIAYFEACEFRTFIKQAPTLLAPFLQNGQQKQQEEESVVASSDVPTSETSSQQVLLEAAATLKVPYTLVQTAEQLQAMVQQLEAVKVFAIDIETTGLDFLTTHLVGVAISVSNALQPGFRPAVNILNLPEYPAQFQVLEKKAGQPFEIHTFYIPIGHEGGAAQLPEPMVLEALQPLLTAEDVIKIVHNGKFEYNVFYQLGIQLRGLLFDTMIASYVYQPENRHGLKNLGFEYFRHNMQEIKELIGTGKNQILFSQAPFQAACDYAACDAHVTLELAHLFLEKMNPDQWTLFYEIELPLMHVLADMERVGMAIDTEYLHQLSQELEGMLKQVEVEIYKSAGMEFNINSPKQVGEVLFDHLGIPPLKKTKGKTGYSTDVKVLEQLAPQHPVVEKILEYRQLFKLKSTYVDTLPTLIHPKTRRIHSSFNQTVTATGRLSSSNPNLQNIPIRSELGRSIRKAFIPGNDMPCGLLLSADYSQIELRLLAHFSQDPPLVEAFRQGEDIHTATASLVFGVDKTAVTKEMRYRAKTVNFGVIYGQSAHGLSEQLKIPRAEAAYFIDRYFQQYPKVKGYIESVKAEARKTGKVSTLCGRVRDLSEDLNSPNRNVREFAERAAFNTPLQGSAADLMKVAMIRLSRKLREEGLQSRMILQVHDELVLEVPEEELDAVTRWVHWAMELNRPLRVPLVVDVATGPSWLES